MEFVSYNYIGFLAAALILYYGLLPCLCRNGKGRAVFLMILSLCFLFFAGGIESLLIYLLTASITWGLSMQIGRGTIPDELLLSAGLFVCFGALVIFKYLNFPAYTLNEYYLFRGMEESADYFETAAPLAISYYTLTLSGYLIDVYRGHVPAAAWHETVLFGGFFAQMQTGPVQRFEDSAGTLFQAKKSQPEDILQGLFRIGWGLFKKLLIADRLNVLVGELFAYPDYYTGFFTVLAALLFSLQLYADFSGAIDIALGSAAMFGVRLNENFRQPWFSTSVAEFWRKWHITLGTWTREYIYIPLGGNRKGLVKQIRNIFIVWTFTGLWHGGSWTYLMGVGLFMAAVMSLHLIWDHLLHRNGRTKQFSRIGTVLRYIRTYLLISAGFFMFRSETFYDAWQGFKYMLVMPYDALESGESLLTLGLSGADLLVLFVAVVVLFCVSVYRERHPGYTAGAVRKKTLLPAVLGLYMVILIFGYYGFGYNAAAFIYNRF